MLPRVLEPEVMDTAEEASDYDAMDHSTVNRVFSEDWLTTWTVRNSEPAAGATPTRLLDVGTGTALIPVELARRAPFVHITGVDLAAEMLHLARRNIDRAECGDRVAVELIDAKRLPYADGTFDSVVSNSIIHHIPEPRLSLAEMVRVLRPGGLLFVRDLFRPDSSAAVEQFVRQYAGGESPRQQQLFRQSFHAALTPDEIAGLIEPLGLRRESVRMTSDRHWTIAAWKPEA